MDTLVEVPKRHGERAIAEILFVPWVGLLLSLIPQIAAHGLVRAIGLGSSDLVRKSDLGGWFEMITATYVVVVITGITIGALRFMKWARPIWAACFVWVLPTIIFAQVFLHFRNTTGPYRLDSCSELFGPDCERTSCLHVMTITTPMIIGIAYSVTVALLGWWSRASQSQQKADG
jgi:hypothetical protein